MGRSSEETAAPAEMHAPALSFATELEGKMQAIARDPDGAQPTIVAEDSERQGGRHERWRGGL